VACARIAHGESVLRMLQYVDWIFDSDSL
jgi:hypothetical protein